MVRLLFLPEARVQRMICSPISPGVSTTISPQLALHKHSSPSFYALTQNQSQDHCRLHMYMSMHSLSLRLKGFTRKLAHRRRQAQTHTDKETQYGRTRKHVNTKTHTHTLKHKTEKMDNCTKQSKVREPCWLTFEMVHEGSKRPKSKFHGGERLAGSRSKSRSAHGEAGRREGEEEGEEEGGGRGGTD